MASLGSLVAVFIIVVITIVAATVIGPFFGSGAFWWKRSRKVTDDLVLVARFGCLWDFQVEVPTRELKLGSEDESLRGKSLEVKL